MYKFDKSKRDQLTDGRTVSYLAIKIGLDRSHLNNILNGNSTTNVRTAYCIVKACNEDAEINDYFERIK